MAGGAAAAVSAAACVWPSQPEAQPTRGLFDLRPQRHSHSIYRLVEIFNEGGDFAPRRVDAQSYVYDIQLVGRVYNFNNISKSCASLVRTHARVFACSFTILDLTSKSCWLDSSSLGIILRHDVRRTRGHGICHVSSSAVSFGYTRVRFVFWAGDRS